MAKCFYRTRRIFLFLIGLCFILNFAGVSSQEVSSQETEVTASKGKSSPLSVVAEQRNFHIVVPGIWRSAQPNEESLMRMKHYGLQTVINLRSGRREEKKEGKLAEKLGLRYYNFPMEAAADQDLAVIDRILSFLHDPSYQPVLFHCAAGKDRTGLIAALYKIKYTNEKFEDIYREMLMFGYDQKHYPGVMRTIKHWCEVNGRSDIALLISPDGSSVSGLSNAFN